MLRLRKITTGSKSHNFIPYFCASAVPNLTVPAPLQYINITSGLHHRTLNETMGIIRIDLRSKQDIGVKSIARVRIQIAVIGLAPQIDFHGRGRRLSECRHNHKVISFERPKHRRRELQSTPPLVRQFASRSSPPNAAKAFEVTNISTNNKAKRFKNCRPDNSRNSGGLSGSIHTIYCKLFCEIGVFGTSMTTNAFCDAEANISRP
jgi:hypothetical protein